jgi:hypothetical protein
MRVAAAQQLPLDFDGVEPAGWAQLPEQARHQVLTLLARLIARSVIEEDHDKTERNHD